MCVFSFFNICWRYVVDIWWIFANSLGVWMFSNVDTRGGALSPPPRAAAAVTTATAATTATITAATATATTTATTARLCASEFVEAYSKILENQQTPKKSILGRWYTQISMFHAHGSNKRPTISSGDGLGAELAKFHQ